MVPHSLKMKSIPILINYYRKYTIMNKDLGEFFKRETKDILNQMCDDLERSLV
jgi:hypothetical protein